MLSSDNIRAYELDMVHLPERPHHSAVIDARDENSEEVSQKSGLFLQVE